MTDTGVSWSKRRVRITSVDLGISKVVQRPVWRLDIDILKIVERLKCNQKSIFLYCTIGTMNNFYRNMSFTLLVSTCYKRLFANFLGPRRLRFAKLACDSEVCMGATLAPSTFPQLWMLRELFNTPSSSNMGSVVAASTYQTVSWMWLFSNI